MTISRLLVRVTASAVAFVMAVQPVAAQVGRVSPVRPLAAMGSAPILVAAPIPPWRPWGLSCTAGSSSTVSTRWAGLFFLVMGLFGMGSTLLAVIGAQVVLYAALSLPIVLLKATGRVRSP